MREIEVGYAVVLREIIDQQATDEGIWFVAQTVTEAHLQQELRKLTAAAEKLTDQILGQK